MKLESALSTKLFSLQAVAIGRLPPTCDASTAGNLYYSTSSKRLTLCDGFSFTNIG